MPFLTFLVANKMRATLGSCAFCQQIQRVYRRCKKIAASGWDHPLVGSRHNDARDPTVRLRNTKHATSSAAAFFVCLSDYQVMSRLKATVLGFVLELGIVH